MILSRCCDSDSFQKTLIVFFFFTFNEHLTCNFCNCEVPVETPPLFRISLFSYLDHCFTLMRFKHGSICMAMANRQSILPFLVLCALLINVLTIRDAFHILSHEWSPCHTRLWSIQLVDRFN